MSLRSVVSSLSGSSELEISDPAPFVTRTEPALRFEVRPNEDGTIDEVLIYVGEACVFHLEQLDDDAYWFAWFGDGPDRERHFDIRRRKKRVEITEP